MNDQEIITIFSLFILGLLGGFSHCSAMCGPLVLTQVGNRLNKISLEKITVFKKLSGIALLPYHFGRITTYCLITLFSSILSKNLKNIIAFKQIAGFLLIIGAVIIFNSTIVKIKLPFKVLNISKSKILLGEISFYKSKFFLFFSRNIKNLISSLFLNPTGSKNYSLGLILGFIPCGLVYGAIVTSLSLSQNWLVLLAMLAFGIGTIPSLFITACGGYYFFSAIQNHLKKLTKIILLINITTLLVMAFGLIFNHI
jgi:sulfite exporter TauE/SafE